MKRKLFSLGCCAILLLTAIFTSCKPEITVIDRATISYVSEFGTLSQSEKVVDKGYKLTAEDLPLLKEDGYTFGRWYINKEEATVGTIINKDTVLVAKWIKILDKTAPKDVAFCECPATNGKAVVNWNIPSDMDSDIKGFELSMSPACGTLINPVMLGSKTNSFSVDGLANGTKYTFTLKSFDTSMNFSKGVSQEVTPEQTSGDKTAPAEVTEHNATNLDGTVALSWKDPSDKDLFGIEITYTPKAAVLSRSMEQMVEGSIFIAPKTQYAEIPNLANNTEYTFTFRTMDLSGNKSAGVTVKCTPRIIEGKPLAITLTPSATNKTKENINVSVDVKNVRKVKTVKYAEGTKTVSDFSADGTEVTNNTFTVIKNGTYTVFVQDVDGKREVKTITINNIDKTAPNSVSNFSGSYNAASETITLSWNEPLDEDYKEVIISDGTNNYTVAKNTTTYVLSNVTADDKVYNFTAITYDNVGNGGKTVNCDVKALKGPAVTAIELSRNHIAYNDTDLTINVTIKGSNFDLIKSQNDKTVNVGIWDSSDSLVGELITATVDESKNTATATVTVPQLTEKSASVEGVKYAIKAIICGTIAENVAPVTISREAWLRADPTLSFTQLPIEDASGKTTTITFKGVNLDVGAPVTVQLYNSDNKPQGNAVPVTITGNEEQTVTAEIPVPVAEGVFTAKVLFNGVSQDKYWYMRYGSWSTKDITHPTVQVYGVPAFDAFTIPNAGTKKKYGNVYGIVKGRNFKAPGVTASNFTVTCSEASITNDYKVEIIDDTTLKVTLIIPVTASNYTVNISSGSKKCDGTFIVKDTKGYNVGDVLLNDGTKVPYSGITAENKEKAVAVVCGFYHYGVVLGIGLKQSEGSLVWVKSGTTGNNTEFTDIICTPSTTGTGAAGTATFTGDTDGSDNWSVICGVDPTGTATDVVAANYPAFNWVNNYGTANKLQGDYEKGWYMPSIAELAELYKNKTTVNAALTAVGGTALQDNYYWSSSQYGSYRSDVWYLVFSDGNVGYGRSSAGASVCCIRAF